MLPFPRRRGKPLRFRPPPWDRNHPAWLALDGELPDDHLARRISRLVDELDPEALAQAYAGVGSPACPPALLLKLVLLQTHQGELSPAAWHRHAQENAPCRWLLFGLLPSRSS